LFDVNLFRLKKNGKELLFISGDDLESATRSKALITFLHFPFKIFVVGLSIHENDRPRINMDNRAFDLIFTKPLEEFDINYIKHRMI